MTRSADRRLRLALLAAFATVLLALALTAPTSAEPNGTLVSNASATRGTVRGIQAATFDIAQAFTTGPHSGGYRLTEINLSFSEVGSTAPTFNLKVCTGSDSAP
ncbi:MAG: hypothetical protein F4X58_13340 [Chloroflexi bacterium]|nr:hypothetical protein [Chloroflexota bacterium]MYC02890.1 hypothetical protein [Chloroflexota bacterium]